MCGKSWYVELKHNFGMGIVSLGGFHQWLYEVDALSHGIASNSQAAIVLDSRSEVWISDLSNTLARRTDSASGVCNGLVS